MTQTDLIEIKNRYDAPGYVYLVRFPHCKNCYKIGSTGNIYNRLQSLSVSHPSIEIIAYGYSNNRFYTERNIQEILNEYSNNKISSKSRGGFNFQFAGDITSTEYFIMTTTAVCNAIMLFDMLCSSTQIGSPNNKYRQCPEYLPIGYGMDLKKFYDKEQRRFVPYPTKFKYGLPVYDCIEMWDNIEYEMLV
jgi:hypothetical protein